MYLHSAAIRRVSNWARGIVLVETGQPVDLVHVEEIDGHRRIFVEMPSGLRTHVPEAALTNRLARLAEGGLTLAGVALAGVLLGYTLGLPAEELAAWGGTAPAVVDRVDG